MFEVGHCKECCQKYDTYKKCSPNNPLIKHLEKDKCPFCKADPLFPDITDMHYSKKLAGEIEAITTNIKKLPRIHYFAEEKADPNDHFLNMSISQGYVPKGCLLGGQLVWGLVSDGKDPCKGCMGDRTICKGRGFE